MQLLRTRGSLIMRGQTEAISPIRIQSQLGTPPNTGRNDIAYPNLTGEEIV